MTIPTTLIGSYPVPDWLRAYPSRKHLEDATMLVVRLQEMAGIDVVTDGELSRFDPDHPETNGMIDHFVLQLDGVRTRLSASELADLRKEGPAYRKKPAGVVDAPLGPGVLDLAEEASAIKRAATHRTKFTLTSPYMLGKVLVDRHYGDLEAVVMQIASIMAEQVRGVSTDVIQVDEANIPGAPEDSELAAAAINTVLEGFGGETCVHVCFGNYGGQTIQQGDYRRLLPFLQSLKADHLLLEMARRGYDELDVLTELPSGTHIGLGVIDIKDNEVESADEVARRIEHATNVLGEDRLGYVNPDCGFWMLSREVSDSKMRALVAGRDRFAPV